MQKMFPVEEIDLFKGEKNVIWPTANEELKSSVQQPMQEFEAAIKQRDGIITQLTANLQQARREKDETMREFLELTEQSQKLQIQFQHVSMTSRRKFIKFLIMN